ncbi:Nnf1-domain-containing protein [Biscogniauxia marginata]|nr:Nnf1-domain-containing protein [Biscogniauxia marginata]
MAPEPAPPGAITSPSTAATAAAAAALPPPATNPEQQQSQTRRQPDGEGTTRAGGREQEEEEGGGGRGRGEGEGGSSPLPARHTPQTPGPRASRFQDVLASSLNHTLGKIGWDNFATCYPTVAARAPGVLRAVQRQMVERLGALCKKEFDSILQARNVVAKLNELESLVSEAERRRDEAGEDAETPVPPHMLPADQVLAAHLAPHLAQQQSQLNAKLQTTQAHNAKLFDEIRRQRAEIQSLVGLLEKVFEDINGANGMMDGVVDELATETRAVEVEMAETR